MALPTFGKLNLGTHAPSIKTIAQREPSSLIGRAYRFANQAHNDQQRKSGDPYLNHVIATAETIARWRLDDTSIAAGLLHDVVEDTPTTRDELVREFGEEVAFLVDGVTKLSRIKYRGVENKVENLRKMILAVSQDLRVVFIKLADRLHNMETLSALPVQKQKRIALETSEIYAPIANRLGMHELSGKLQDIAFPYLYPKEARWLRAQVADEYGARRTYLESFKPELERTLKDMGIAWKKIDFRAKHYYSLYKKLLRYNMDVSRIYDLIALRIILENEQDCYAALGAIHQTWPPLPGRIKDYIAMPKANNYRSLHTTVIGPDGKYVEIQLRTQDMHEENEYGIAAHWLYKEHGSTHAPREHRKIADALQWMRQIRMWQERHQAQGIEDADDFLRTMKLEFFKDRIFVITPRGDVVDLPAGASPVDFAYQIHSEIGNTCVGAKVNEQFVALDQELQSGDMVEILTQKNKRPSEGWLSFVKMSSARDHIRSALRQKRNTFSSRRTPTKAELRIVGANRIGILKDVSNIITRSHFNVISVNVPNTIGSQFAILKLQVDSADRDKLTKLTLKLKRLPDVQEVGFQLLT